MINNQYLPLFNMNLRFSLLHLRRWRWSRPTEAPPIPSTLVADFVLVSAGSAASKRPRLQRQKWRLQSRHSRLRIGQWRGAFRKYGDHAGVLYKRHCQNGCSCLDMFTYPVILSVVMIDWKKNNMRRYSILVKLGFILQTVERVSAVSLRPRTSANGWKKRSRMEK